ncbi:MAG: M13 family metallopeptidase [Vicinamibacteria bacterium]
MKTAALSMLILAAPIAAVAQEDASERPLQALPYTPGLDPTAMDRSIDPCIDFFAYSCGSWLSKNPIPADQSSWDVYGKLHHENLQYLWGLLDSAAKPTPDRIVAEQKSGDYFASCMDEGAVEAAGGAPLKPDLDAIAALPSARAIAAWAGTAHLVTRSDRVLFGFGADQDAKDSSQVIAIASAGGLGLPDRDYYVKDDAKSKEILARYRAHVARMLELVGDSPARAAAAAETILRIETALAKASLTAVEKRDPYKIYHRMTPAEAQTLTPGFSWAEYLKATGKPGLGALNVMEPAFFKELARLLAAEPLAAWKDYLRWHVASERAPYLSSAFVQEDFAFRQGVLRGVKQMPPRWRRCVQLVDRDLGEALGQVFVAKAFGPDVKRATEDMVKAIEQAMEERLRAEPWMSDATRARALEKLHAMRNKIGYPEHWRDYGRYEVRRGDFAGNVARGIRFEQERQLAKIGQPIDRGEWGMTPPTVNAEYNPSMNDMNFPAGVLLPPLFDLREDAAPGYGNTGSTIGHELTHGFDDEGRQYDAQGNLRDWWTADDAKEFEKRTSCIVDQYAQYTVVDDIKINSRLTLGEDVADLGGTILAHGAWKSVTKGLDLKPVDGLAPDQRFFVGLAQWACGDEREEQKRMRALTNPHSPGRYRINGVVANMPEFREAFGCQVGQPMVKDPVCRVW